MAEREFERFNGEKREGGGREAGGKEGAQGAAGTNSTEGRRRKQEGTRKAREAAKKAIRALPPLPPPPVFMVVAKGAQPLGVRAGGGVGALEGAAGASDGAAGKATTSASDGAEGAASKAPTAPNRDRMWRRVREALVVGIGLNLAVGFTLCMAMGSLVLTPGAFVAPGGREGVGRG